MRKRVVLALLLVVAMVVTSGCSLVVKDAEVDAQTPIITVVGQTFTKGEVNALVQNSLNYQASLYSMYGMTFDPTSESAISSAQESVINGLIEQAVVDAKMDELGFGNCTNTGACQAECPKAISIAHIARLNREFLSAKFED
mgnify:CR=1 FL=1